MSDAVKIISAREGESQRASLSPTARSFPFAITAEDESGSEGTAGSVVTRLIRLIDAFGPEISERRRSDRTPDRNYVTTSAGVHGRLKKDGWHLLG